MKQRKIDDRELEEISGAGGVLEHPKPNVDSTPLPVKDLSTGGSGGVGNTGQDSTNQGSGGNSNMQG